MKIIVVGGYGDIGSCVVEKLIEFSSHQVTIGGRNLKKAHSVSGTFKDYVPAIRVDVENRATMNAVFRGFDLVINCAGPFYKYGANAAIAASRNSTVVSSVSPCVVSGSKNVMRIVSPTVA